MHTAVNSLTPDFGAVGQDDAWGALGAVVFDFDGLCCDTEGAQVAAATELFDDHGATLPLDRWIGVIGTSSGENFWIPWLEEQVGPVDEHAVMADFQRRNHGLVARLDPNPGVASLIHAVDEAGLPLAIASSSPSTWVFPIAERLGLKHRFDTIVCREHAPRAKPAPDLYLEAARRLGVSPRLCVALEDSHIGSLAAVRAGMRCVAIPNTLTVSQNFDHVHAKVGSMTHIRGVAHLGEIVGFSAR